MAPSSSSSPPSKTTKCAKKKKTSLTIKKDGIICWDGFSMLDELKDESPANLNDVLTEMGVKHLSHDEQTALIRNYNNCVGKLNLKNYNNQSDGDSNVSRNYWDRRLLTSCLTMMLTILLL
jgi:hypothetical protein